MRQKKKKMKTSKAATSVSTAFLVLSTAVSAAGNAAQTNEFVISSDKSYAAAGDSFCVFVDYLPDTLGAAGFTVDLHYDPEKVAPNVPDEGGDGPAGGFYIITNYKEDEGIVRLVGANMQGDNVSEESRIATASFTVLDGAEGGLDYWLDVEAVVAYDGEDYVNADFSAPDSDAPYSVSVLETPVTTTTTTTTTSVTTEPPATETELPATTTTYETTTTSEPVIVEIPDPDITSTVTTRPELVTEPEIATSAGEGDQPLFEYSAAPYDEDAGDTEVVQYALNISDYITDYSSRYDIRVKLDSTGLVQGGIGMMNSLGEWESQLFETESGSDEWVFTDLDPAGCWDQVYVQIYYLQYGARLEIDSIEFIPHAYGESAQTPEISEPEAPSVEAPADDGQDDLGYTPTVPVEPDDTEDDRPAEDIPQQSEENAPETGADAWDNGDAAVPDMPENNAEVEAPEAEETSPDAEENTPETGGTFDDSEEVVPDSDGNTESGEDAAPDTSENDSSPDDSSVSEVEEQVSQMTSEANRNGSSSNGSSSNPNTGSGRMSPVMRILQWAAALEIAYSLFAVVSNRLGVKKSARK